jgi:glycosyl transferase family 25
MNRPPAAARAAAAGSLPTNVRREIMVRRRSAMWSSLVATSLRYGGSRCRGGVIDVSDYRGWRSCCVERGNGCDRHATSMLQHIPRMDLHFDGDCAQANGLDLPVVVINLSHRTDRWQALYRRMRAVGFTKLVRALAMDGARLADDQIAALTELPADAVDQAPCSHLTLTRPAIGCFLSHLGIWRWMLETDLPQVLVLEDDAVPSASFSASRLREIMASMPKNTGLVLLGRMIMGGLADTPDGSGLARIYYFNGTFAYLITPLACRSLLQHLLPLRSHIDHQISKVLIDQRRVFEARYAEPPLFEPDWSLRSDCYVPLADDVVADCELGEIIDASRRVLLGEGRPLLARMG